jgi:hypothetical protein
MMKLLLRNLNTLLRLNYYDKTIIKKFKCFIMFHYNQIIMMKLLLRNLNTILRSNYYGRTMVGKFKYFIKSKLL